jgi:hypothetical protein
MPTNQDINSILKHGYICKVKFETNIYLLNIYWTLLIHLLLTLKCGVKTWGYSTAIGMIIDSTE